MGPEEQVARPRFDATRRQDRAGRPEDRRGPEVDGRPRPASPSITLMGRRFRLPAHRGLRITLGVLLVIGGLLGFLPILGFWMIPLGLIVLSVDFAPVRRWRRRTAVRWETWRRKRREG